MMLRASGAVWVLFQALARGVGAVDCAPATGSLTLKTTSDVSSLKTCPTFTGNIVVAADGPSTIDLTGLTTVTGNIDVENVAKLTSLSSSTLNAVSSFTLNNLPVLSNLSFPALSNFSSLKWYNLPKLEACVIATGALAGEIQEISIQNTGIKSLKWLTWPLGSQLNITGNPNLQAFSIPYNTINAGSALTFSNNSNLDTIDVSQVSGIYGGLQVSDNSALKELDFEKLESIGGYVQLSGGFTNVSMQALSGINGALRVEATGDITSLCTSLGSKKLNGHYDCITNSQNIANPTTTNTATSATPTTTSTETGDNNDTDNSPEPGSNNLLSKKQAAAIAVSAILFTLLVTALTIYILRLRSRRKVQEISPSNRNSAAKTLSTDSLGPLTGIGSTAFDTSTPTSPSELESPIVKLELAGGKRWTNAELPATVPVEMDGSHGVSEVGGATERHELPG